jgi:O-methyltransferase
LEIPCTFGKNTLKIHQLDKIAERLKDVPGDVAEFGCFEGENTEHMASCFKGRRLWAWDTFEGMPDDNYIESLDRSDPPGKWKPAGDVVKKFQEWNEGRGWNIIPVKGLFSQTIPTWNLRSHFEGSPDVRFAFIHIDCDHYWAYKRVLEFITPLMSPGGIVRMDDYGCCAGAKQAADEWSAETGHAIVDNEWIYF